MDINGILKGMECTCGKIHRCNIEYVYIEKNAVGKMAEVCKAYNNILIVADENTFAAAGDSVEKVLENKKINKVIFEGKKVLIPDEIAISKVYEHIEGVELIIGIGSGVIQDLCKYVSFFSKHKKRTSQIAKSICL